MATCNRCGRNYPTSSPFWLFDSSFCQSCNAKIKSDRKAEEYDKKYSRNSRTIKVEKKNKSSVESKEEFKIDTEKLRESFSKKWKNFKCNCCEQNDWNIADEIYELRAFRWGSLFLWKTPIIPIVPVTCSNCWNTIFINAIISKLIDNDKKNDE